MPDTGGSNIPAINDLVSSWGIVLGDYVFEGDFKIGTHDMYFASGSSIVKFPQKDSLLVKKSLNDQGFEILNGEKKEVKSVSILGLYNPSSPEKGPQRGRLSIYGDSNCLDSAHMQKDCFWMIEALLQFSTTGRIPDIFKHVVKEEDIKTNEVDNTPTEDKSDNLFQDLPHRMDGNHLYRYSKVLEHHLGNPQTRSLPSCLSLKYETAVPLNQSLPSNLYKSQKLLSVSGVDIPMSFPQAKHSSHNFEHYESARWETAALFSDMNDSEVRLPSLTTICMLVLLVLVFYLLKQWWLQLRPHRPRKRRSRTTVKRLLLQALPSRVPTV